MTQAKTLVITKPLSLLVIVAMILHLLQTYLHIILMTNLVVDLTLVNNVTPVCHALAINLVSARKPTPMGGLSAKYTTPPLVPRLPNILMCYMKNANQPKSLELLHWLVADPIHHHLAIVILALPH